MAELTDKNLLILRGNGGRELLREQATLRGATVETVECYQRVLISYNNEEQTSICIRSVYKPWWSQALKFCRR